MLQRLEEIDDDADQHKIGFVKINDKELAFEYGLEVMPSLVYYRKKVPIVYDGTTSPAFLSPSLSPSLQHLNLIFFITWTINFADERGFFLFVC